MKEKSLYSYRGGVLRFGIPDYSCWIAQTFATSEKQAVNNLRHQYRQKFGYEKCVPIALTGKVVRGEYTQLTKV